MINQLPTSIPKKIKAFPPMLYNHNKLGKLIIDSTTATDIFKDNLYMTQIRDLSGKVLAKDKKIPDFENNILNDYLMKVDSNYRNKGHHLGELLRLTSIIELLENFMDKIKLYSVKDAIQFHSKYKFEPNIEIACMEKVLNTISKDKNPLVQDIKKRITKIKRYSSSAKSIGKAEQINRISNLLVNKYINTYSKNNEKIPDNIMEYGIPMELTKKNILHNKKFFNQLFLKHKINYQI